MPKTEEPITNETVLNEAALAKFFSSPAGQDALRRMREPKSDYKRPALTDSLMDKGLKMAEDEKARYIPIDPKTGEPLSEASKYFWQIKGTTFVSVGTSSELRLDLYIIKYKRDKTYQANVLDSRGHKTGKMETVHEPDSEYGYNLQGQWSLIRAADRFIDLEDFLKTFKLDKTSAVDAFEDAKKAAA